jgi:uncharacterized protein (UPF0261 family)
MAHKLPSVLMLVSMDTKGNEAKFMEKYIKESGVNVLIMDTGIMGQSLFPVSITRDEVAEAAGKSLAYIQSIGHEGKALSVMIEGAKKHTLELLRENKVQGIIGIGGSMGTTMGTSVMRSVPFGIPKVMVSTMASKNTRPFVGTKDILMYHSVCDLSGLNHLTRKVLKNAAHAIAGMVKGKSKVEVESKPLIFISTLGTTEACAKKIQFLFEQKGKEVIIFHTVGSGGEAMEEMMHTEKVEALIDLSLHEIADNQFGGDYDAGPDRGLAAMELGIPAILIPGNIDFIVTGPIKFAEKHFPNRKFHMHNAAITCIRVEQEEIKTLAKHISGICNKRKGTVDIMIPSKGFSGFDRPDGPLYDPEAPGIFTETLKRYLDSGIPVHILPYHINEPEFALEILKVYENRIAGRVLEEHKVLQ